MEQTEKSGFTSYLNTKEKIAVLGYFPMHVLILPFIIGIMMGKGLIGSANANVLIYGTGMFYMLVIGFGFLRRDFESLCDAPFNVIRTVAGSYLWMIVSNYGVNDIVIILQEMLHGKEAELSAPIFCAVLLIVLPFIQDIIRKAMDSVRERNRLMASILSIAGMVIIVLSIERCAIDMVERNIQTALSNPNSNSVADIAKMSWGPVAGMAIFMAPIVEEMIFRAGIFGTIAKKSRIAAYTVTIAAFSLYHMSSFIGDDITNIVYLIQYVPISFLLCRSYEKTNTIWASIFLHMTVNGISMFILNAVGSVL